MTYLNLKIGASRRMAALQAAADKLNAGHNLRKSQADATPYTWRDVRYSGFHNAHASRCELSPGRNGETAIWYCHTGPAFNRERFADECEGVRIDHHGWYADADGSRTVRGLVVALPHGRFLAGYYSNDNGERVYFMDVYTDETDAAHAADGHAETIADAEREHDEKYQAAREIEDSNETAIQRLRECLALRNNPCFRNLRDEITGLVESIRDNRDTLQSEYSDVL